MNKLLILTILLISVSCFAIPTLTSVIATPVPTTFGENTTFTAIFTDTANKSYSLLVCKTDRYTYNTTHLNCTDGVWCATPTNNLVARSGTTGSGWYNEGLYSGRNYSLIINMSGYNYTSGLINNHTSIETVSIPFWKDPAVTGNISTNILVRFYRWNTNYATTIAGAVLGNVTIKYSDIPLNAKSINTAVANPTIKRLDFPVRNLTTTDILLMDVRTTGGDTANKYGWVYTYLSTYSNGVDRPVNYTAIGAAFYDMRNGGWWGNAAHQFAVYSDFSNNIAPKTCNYTTGGSDLQFPNLYYFGYICTNAPTLSCDTLAGTFNVTCPYSLLTFDVKDEETNETIDAQHGVTFTLMNNSRQQIENQSYSSNGYVNNFPICMDVGDATLLDSFHQYWGASGSYESVRYYFIQNMSVNATTTNLSMIYLIPNNYSRLIQLVLKDNMNSPIKDAYIYFQRFYPNTNEYKLVAMQKTDRNGYGTVYLRANDVYYRIVVVKDGEILASLDPQIIDCSQSLYSCQFNLNLRDDPAATYFDYMGHAKASCANTTLENDTMRVLCTVTDTSGLQPTFKLELFKMSIFNTSIAKICNMSYTGSSGTIWCDVANGSWQNESFTWWVTVSDVTNSSVKSVGHANFKPLNEQLFEADTSFFLVFLVLLPIIFIPLNLPIIPLLINGVIILSGLIGLLSFDVASVSGLIFAYSIVMLYMLWRK